MTRQLSRVAKLQFLWMLFFSIHSVSAQTVDSREVVKDSMDRYGSFGIRPGAFFNLKKENRFASAALGVFLDYNFGIFRHSIEIDFLTKRYRKFFRNAYSPCLTYHFAIKKQLNNQMELHPGIFVNCRKDVINRKEYVQFNDTIAYYITGRHTIVSIGPSLEISRRIFFPGKNNFITLGSRIAYSFDILGFSSPKSQERLTSSSRFQKDALTFTLKIGWGKLIQPARNNMENDPELRIINY